MFGYKLKINKNMKIIIKAKNNLSSKYEESGVSIYFKSETNILLDTILELDDEINKSKFKVTKVETTDESELLYTATLITTRNLSTSNLQKVDLRDYLGLILKIQ